MRHIKPLSFSYLNNPVACLWCIFKHVDSTVEFNQRASDNEASDGRNFFFVELEIEIQAEDTVVVFRILFSLL